MQSPPPTPRGAWPLATMISFWPLNFWGPPQVCLERRCQEKRPWTVCQEQVGASAGGQGSLGCAVLPAAFWCCRNKRQGQPRRENEVAKYAAGRKSVKGQVGQHLRHLAWQMLGRGEEAELHRSLAGMRQSRGSGAPKEEGRKGAGRTGRELRSRLRIQVLRLPLRLDDLRGLCFLTYKLNYKIPSLPLHRLLRRLTGRELPEY